MLTILNVTIPFFAVIGCGYFSEKLGILGHASRTGLNGFVFYFALPVLLFSIMSNARFDDGFEWRFLAAWSLVSIVLFVLAFVIAKSVFRLDQSSGAVHALGGVYGNTGYVGIPLVIVAFGPDASVPVIVCLTIDLVLMIPISMFFIEAASGSRDSGQLLHVLGKTIRSLVKNPLIIAIVAGTGMAATGFKMPEIIEKFTRLLGTAAAPCALFALGSSLYGQPVRGAMAEVGFITLVKLLAHPLLVWYAMFGLFGINDLWGFAAVVAATMPVAATVYVLAQQYDTYVVRTSTAIVFSTAASVVTVTAVLAYLPAAGLAIGIGRN